MNQRYVVVDVETTGFSPFRGDRVIEIGAVAVKNNQMIEEFHTLIDAGVSIPWQVQRVHGITDLMVAGKPLPHEVYPTFSEFIEESVLVAHNASFDMAFLRHEFLQLDLPLRNKSICTVELSRKRFPRLRNHKLDTVAHHVLGGIPEGLQRHRALGDAKLTALVWMKINHQEA